MSLFCVYTHLWTYSGLHSARRLLTSLIYPYIHLILRFSGPSLALFSRWQRVHGYTSLIRPRFHSSLHSTSTFSEHFRDPGIYIRSTFYIYTSYFRIYDNAVNPQNSSFSWTFIIYALSQTLSFSVQITTQSSILFHKHFSEHLWVIKNVISCGWTFCEHSPPKHVRPPYSLSVILFWFKFFFYFAVCGNF